MKKFLATAACLVFALAFTNSVYASANEQNTIIVTGESAVSMPPDVANISLGVETQGETAVIAQAQNSAEMEAVIAAIMALGIEESNIQTRNFFMHSLQDWSDGAPRTVGFQVSNSLDVTVTDLSIVGKVISAATEAGANMSSSVNFGLLDGTEVYNQALAQAVADANVKAQTIARALGKPLGSLINVTEISAANFVPITRAQGGAVAMADSAASWSVPVQGGELSITARVQITFAVN